MDCGERAVSFVPKGYNFKNKKTANLRHFRKGKLPDSLSLFSDLWVSGYYISKSTKH